MAETIKGLNIKLGLDGSELASQLKEINSSLKEEQKDLRAINANLKYDSSNLDLWKSKQEKLNSLLDETKKKLEAQNKVLEEGKKSLKVGAISEEEYNKLKRNVDYTNASVARLNKELNETNNKIIDLNNVNLTKLSEIGSTLTKKLTLPIMAAVTALSTLAVKSANAAEKINDTSKALGLTIESLQIWQYSASKLGSSADSIEKAFLKVNSIIGDIATGNGDRLTSTLSTIGLSIDDLKGKDTEAVFNIIRLSIAKLNDESLKIGVATDLFGDKLGTELLPLLSAEESQLKILKDETFSLGIVTESQAKISSEFSEKIKETKQELSNLSMLVAAEVLPILTLFIKKLSDEILPKVKIWIESWSSLSDSTKRFIYIIIALAAAVGPVITIVTEIIPVLKTLKLVLTATGKSGIFAGVGINFATLGIGALIAIIAAFLLSSESFKNLLLKIGEVALALLEPLMGLVEILMDSLKPVMDIIVEVISVLFNLLEPILNIILLPIMTQLEVAAQILSLLTPLIEVLASVINTILAPALAFLYSLLKPILDILQKIIDAISWIFDKVGKVFGAIGKGIKNLFGRVFGNNSSTVNNSSVSNNVSNNTTNHVTVNTSANTFDINSINRALGGNFI